MGAASEYLQRAILDACFSGKRYEPPSEVFLAILVDPPAEASGGGYRRLRISCNDESFPASTGSNPTTIRNGTAFVFPAASGGPWSGGATMNGWGIFDAADGGNLLWSGRLVVPKPVLEGDAFFFPAGSIAVSFN